MKVKAVVSPVRVLLCPITIVITREYSLVPRLWGGCGQGTSMNTSPILSVVLFLGCGEVSNEAI